MLEWLKTPCCTALSPLMAHDELAAALFAAVQDETRSTVLTRGDASGLAANNFRVVS
jgi:hypothetical protein